MNRLLNLLLKRYWRQNQGSFGRPMIMKQKIYHSVRSVKWILLICLTIGSALITIWGCASSQQETVSSASAVSIPADTPVSLTISTSSSTQTSSPIPTPSPTPTPSSGETEPLSLVDNTEETETSIALPEAEPRFVMRGIWVHPKSVDAPWKADKVLDRIQAGNFNTVFLLIFLDGYAYYDSNMTETKASSVDNVPEDFDLLGYFVTEAHRRGIEVHAWFGTGRIGTRYGEPGPILSEHPEWSIVDASGSSQDHWLNFARPDARQFMSDLILEVVENYEVDGVHLDYIRYPSGGKWSFDDYSISAFADQYGMNLESLRGIELPVYGSFSGNPLIGVATAEVLAEFDDGLPAVMLNTYGQGEVVTLNWHAEDQKIAASSEILRRSIEYLLGEEGGDVYIFRSETNEAEFGPRFFRKSKAWLESLGWQPTQVRQEDLATLDATSVVVVPNVYLMEAATADELTLFVERGGSLVFVDGPVKSMKYVNMRALTGMQNAARFFKGERTLLATGQSELIPAGNRVMDPQARQELISRWNTFREESVTALVQEVYQQVKRVRPEVQVSAAVFRNSAWAADIFQNWYHWLDQGYVDFVVPMAYVDEVSALESLIDEWQTEGDLERTMVGLGVANFKEQDAPLKTPQQLVQEIELVERRGIDRVSIFAVVHISDDQLEALATGPFAP